MTDNITQTLTKNKASEAQSWSVTLPLLLLMLAAILAIFHETAWSMVSIWYRSETFAHGFIIAPITIWLIWEKRRKLSTLAAVPEYRVLILLAGAGFVWLLGYLVSALVIQQLALVALLIFSIWAVLGNKISWIISFPLAYLFFAVPMGEDLVPPLMEITATFTVTLVKLTGIPVFREGLYFSLPTGNWSVVEACSGVRYLIASITLGALYAYLTYSSLSKRIIFIFISAIVPIIANSVRAYIIVMLGHMSDMKIATGVDHLIYGWLFFGLVMLILFWIGAKWRDPEDAKSNKHTDCIISDQKEWSSIRLIPAVLITIIITGVWPVIAIAIESNTPVITQNELKRPANFNGWVASEKPFWSWSPLLLGSDKRLDYFTQNGAHRVMVSVGQYIAEKQGAEMINSQNLLVDPKDKNWRVVSNQKQSINIDANKVIVDVAVLKNENTKLLTWSWYRIGDFNTANNYLMKIYEGIYKLTMNKPPSSKIIYAIELEKDTSTDAAILLEEFVSKSYSKLLSSLDQVDEN